MESLLFRVEDQLFRYEIPRDIKGESEFFRQANDELFGADLIPGALEVQHNNVTPLFVNGQGGQRCRWA